MELNALPFSAPATAQWIVAYDIADPHRLRRVAKVLELAGQRLQKSVFNVEDRRERLASLARSLGQLIDDNEDKVLMHPCCSGCRRATKWQGLSPSEDHEPFWIV